MATKQTIFACLATTLVLASCSQEDVINNEPMSPRQTIGFNVIADRTSRATNLYNASNLPSEFVLGAWFHTGNAESGREYITQDIIKRNGSKYENVTDLRYWPNNAGEKLNFYAFQSGTDNTDVKFSLTDASGSINPNLAEYALATDAQSQHDLIFATAYDKEKTTSGDVQLNFRHALAQVGFSAKTDSRHIHVEIEEVAMGGMSTVANLYFGATADLEPRWEAAKTDIKTLLTSKTGDVQSGTFTPAVLKLTDKTADGKVTTHNLTPATSQAIMALPYKYEEATGTDFAGGNTNGAYIRVKAKIWNIADPTVGYNETKDVALLDGYLYIPCEFNLNAGYKYHYTISFGTGTAGLDGNGNPTFVKVNILDPTVEDWKDSATIADQTI